MHHRHVQDPDTIVKSRAPKFIGGLQGSLAGSGNILPKCGSINARKNRLMPRVGGFCHEFHFLKVIVVPLPIADVISKSSTRRLALESPNPKLLAVENPSART